MEEHPPVDICILCALAEEAEAVRNEFASRSQHVSFQTAFTRKKKYLYWHATIKNLREESLTTLVMAMPFPGPVETPIFVQALLEEFHPRFIAMTGICAGDRKVAIGDLVVASYAFHHDAGKIEPGKEGQDQLRPEWRTAGPQSRILMYAQALTAWKRPLIEMKQHLLGRDLLPDEYPRCLLAPIASGMAVQGNDPFPRLQEHNRKVVFLDQEVAAFYRTLQEPLEVPFLAVKSVCDNGDPAKNDHYHDYAARASAIYLLHFLLEYVNEETMPRRDPACSSDPAGPSGVWNVPYLRNPHFTGRDKLLDLLHRQLSPEKRDALATRRQDALIQPQALKGLGGIGKTQIAVEYAYRSREQGRYLHTFWVDGTSEEAIIASFVMLAELLPAFPAKSETDQRKLVASIKRWLERCEQHWLLIFDNVDTVSLVQEYLPQQGNGNILLTTRADAVGALAASLGVEKMGLEEGVQFLLHRVQGQAAFDGNSSEVTNIVLALDSFPLALDQAGAYIEETRCGFSTYLQLYQTHRKAMLARRGIQAMNYPDSVVTTWSLSFQKVKQANPAAAELLRLCAFLSPDRIPEELIRNDAARWPSQLQKATADLFAFNQMIEELLKFSLVKRLTEDHVLSVHRLVQAVLFDAMTEQERDQWIQQIIQTLNKIFPDSEPATWRQCERLLLHVLSCLEKANPTQKSLELASLASKSAYYFCEHARYVEAEPLYHQSLQIYEQMCGSQHLHVAQSQHQLANLYVKQGKYTEAEMYYQRAIQVKETILEPEHPSIALTLHSLANLYAEQGKYAKAEVLYRQILQNYQQRPNTMYSYEAISSLSDLATLYQELGKYTEAEGLYQRILQVFERVAEPPNLDMALFLNNLAVLYKTQGKYAEAEPLHQQALQIREQILGSGHPDVAQSLHNLANLRVELSQYIEAEALYQRALYIRERVLEPDHPDIVQNLLGLARLYHEQGKYSEAERIYQQVRQKYEQKLGPSHPALASCIDALANLYMIQGKYKKAELLYQETLQIYTQSLGSEHPDVAQVLNSLANLHADRGQCTEAEALYQRALHIREQKLGPLHPSLAESLNNLATLFCQKGKYAEARPLYQRALHIREQALGVEHPSTASSLNNLASCYTEQSNYTEAEPLYQRALQIREQALGSEHIDTANSLHDFAMFWQAQGIHEKARIFYERALAILLRSLGSTHPYTIDTYLRLQAVLVAIGEQKEVVLPSENPGPEENGNGAG